MSTNAIEKLLWQVNSSPAEAERYRADTQAYLNEFRLDEEERSLLTSWDVGTLASRDVNPLLLMSAFATVNGMDKVVEYLMKINQPGGNAPAA